MRYVSSAAGFAVLLEVGLGLCYLPVLAGLEATGSSCTYLAETSAMR